MKIYSYFRCSIFAVGMLVFSALSAQNPTADLNGNTTAATLPKGIHYTSGPSDGAALALAAANYARNFPSGVVEPLRIAGTFELHSPLALFRLQGATPKLTEAVSDNQFFYPISIDGKPVAMANVPVDKTGKPLHPANLVGQSKSAAIARALDFLSNHERVKTGHYEARLINIPVMAGGCIPIDSTLIWLKSEDDAPDLIYLVEGEEEFSGLHVKTLYTGDEFTQTMQAAYAARKIEPVSDVKSVNDMAKTQPVAPAQ